MKIKKEYLILGAAIVVLSAYLIFRSQNRSFYDLPKIPAIAGEDIAKIDIEKKGRIVTLKKINSDWKIMPEEYLADKAKVNNMLDSIEKLSLTALVSKSKNYDIYDLSSDKKITVKAWASDGSLLREFDIGKTAESYRHTHVKLPEDFRVYHANTNIRPTFDQKMEDSMSSVLRPQMAEQEGGYVSDSDAPGPLLEGVHSVQHRVTSKS